jgi:hypothetical protein
MKRNDVVLYRENGVMYGRVVRFVDPETVLWICNGRHIHVTKIIDLVVTDYKGVREWTGSEDLKTYYQWSKGSQPWKGARKKFERPARFDHMTSLRKLKQKASFYHHENAWKTPLDYEYLTRRDHATQ